MSIAKKTRIYSSIIAIICVIGSIYIVKTSRGIATDTWAYLLLAALIFAVVSIIARFIEWQRA
jgi:hypothetical protein